MINRTVLQGRLVRDPELRMTSSNIPVCSFTVAWNESYKDQGKTLFLQCTAWRTTGEFVQKYFYKGSQIIVEGPLSTREWEDKDGNRRTTVELTVDRVHFCGDKHESAGANPEITADNNMSTSKGSSSKKYDYSNKAKSAQEAQFTELTEPDDGELPF